jgi:hypothetical protein
MAATKCATLGGNSFNPIATGSTVDRGSTHATGRHGTSNLWHKWPKSGSSAGITARAPYNIGHPITPPTLAGSNLHLHGFGLGAHGHGVGVVPAAIGGPHNPQKGTAVMSQTRDKSGARTAQPQGICLRCTATWLVAGVAIVLFMVVTGR